MKKLLILITAYNVSRHLENVIDRLPLESLEEKYAFSILIVDDKSDDNTLEKANKVKLKYPKLKVDILSNNENRGYGGVQKIGYYYALKNNFDVVALLHGDAQYAPEKIIEMVDPIFKNQADAIQGSRMINKFGALKGRMPFYKFLGNIFLTFVQNTFIGLGLSEYHSGYRAYAVKALREIPFNMNSNFFHFDTEILIQLNLAKKKIKEIPIPTYYGEEISSLNSIKYGFAILKTTFIFFVQKFGIFYEPKFNIKKTLDEKYVSKLSFASTHNFIVKKIKKNSKVLSLGCGTGYVEDYLIKNLNCEIVAFDEIDKSKCILDNYTKVNLNHFDFHEVSSIKFDYVLFLDVIEHLDYPEKFLKKLNNYLSNFPDTKLFISTPNVANFFIRLMMFFGEFNYGPRGILDFTHKRLFTLNSFKKILLDNEFKVKETRGVPIPFPLIIKHKLISNCLIKINSFFIKLNIRLFAFQFLIMANSISSLDFMLKNTKKI